MIGSIGISLDKELKLKKSYNLSEEEKEVYSFYKERLKKAKEQRDKVREEFDDMSYEDDYILNKRAVNTYLRPKINDAEVRVNTPTTEKKVEIVWNEILSMNLQPEVLAFDQEDNEVRDLGVHFTDIVKRTNEIERDDDRYVDGILELLSQRAVFIEELFLDYSTYDKGKKKVKVERCEKRFLSGLQVYLGDISMPAWRFNDQPYIVKYERMNYWEASKIYGDWEMWQFVKPGIFNDGASGDTWMYRMNSLKSDEVEIIHYMSHQDDEYNVMINGVLMLAPGTSYRKTVGELDGYHIRMIILKPIALDFAYGKSLVSSAKTLQALDNETLRNLIRKFRQGIEPPMGTRSGKIIPKDVWNPGTMTQGLSDKDIFKLDPSNAGVTNSEMAVFKMINDMTTEFVGTMKVQGTPGKRTTATEILQAQKEAVKLLGLSVMGAMRLKREATYLRVLNVLDKYSKPTKRRKNDFTNKIEEVYKKFTISGAQLDGEKTGKKIVQFMDRSLTEEELSDTYQYEEAMSKGREPLRIVAVNVKKLRDLKLTWFVSVINKEKDSSELAKAMFQDKIAQGMQVSQVTGRPLNADKVIESFERVWGLKDFFQRSAPTQLAMPDASQLGQQSNLAEGMQGAMAAQHQRPTINNAMPA